MTESRKKCQTPIPALVEQFPALAHCQNHVNTVNYNDNITGGVWPN